MLRFWPALGLMGMLGCAGPADRARHPPTDPAADTAAGVPFESGGATELEPEPYNLLVVLVDDLGIDKVGAYGAHPSPPPTPNIDELASRGVMFRNAWVMPTCSPTRAALLSGRYPRRWGIGDWIAPNDERVQLPLDEVTIPEALRASRPEYANAMLGKWHISHYGDLEEAVLHPNLQGFDHYAGSLANPKDMTRPDPNVERNYHSWEKVTNGVVGWSQTYMTTDTADDAIEQMTTLPEPWFLYVAFNAPHTPVHVPPVSLTTRRIGPDAPLVEKHDSMVEALDTELGRMLRAMDREVRERTVIVFMSDNGTPDFAIRPPHIETHAKGTVWEGGVNVPLIVAGPVVDRPGSESLALVHAVDLFPTLLDLADAPYDDGIERPGTSFLPHVRDPDLPSVHDRLISERFFDNGPGPYRGQMRTIRSEDFKLVEIGNGETFLFEMVAPYDEGYPIAEEDRTPGQAQQYAELLEALHEYLEDVPILE